MNLLEQDFSSSVRPINQFFSESQNTEVLYAASINEPSSRAEGTHAKFFGKLVVQTDEARRAFETHDVVVDAVANGLTVQRYRKLLLELYHVVWHFNPISAAATSRLSDDHREVRYFLYDHMQEEKGHEIWVANDLQAVGVNAEEIEAYAPSEYVRALNGYNYWAADRSNPCSVLGMLYCLEVIASVYGGPFANALQESLLLDGTHGVSFIGSHATMDAKHMAELRQVVNTVIDAPSHRAVVDSALVNFHHFTKIIARI